MERSRKVNRTTKKRISPLPQGLTFSPRNPRFEIHVIAGDWHIPDQDKDCVNLFKQVVADLRPDYVHIYGDFLNFTKISKYNPDPYDHVDLVDEITAGKVILNDIVKLVRINNSSSKILYYEGNHEERLIRFLGRQALQLAELEVNNEHVVSVPHLLGLKDLKVEWVPYHSIKEFGAYVFNHGVVSRSKAGYTAHALMEKYGSSGSNGHTHRLALVTKMQRGKLREWFEVGCMCSLDPRYMVSPDWVNGFATAIYDKKTKLFYPEVHVINSKSVRVGSRIYLVTN